MPKLTYPYLPPSIASRGVHGGQEESSDIVPFIRSVPWFPVGRFRDFKRVGAGGEKESGEQQYTSETTRQLAMGGPHVGSPKSWDAS